MGAAYLTTSENSLKKPKGTLRNSRQQKDTNHLLANLSRNETTDTFSQALIMKFNSNYPERVNVSNSMTDVA